VSVLVICDMKVDSVTGFYKSSEASGGCTPCSCDDIGTIPRTSCDADNGQCQCVQGGSGVGGLRCDTCLPGYWKQNQTAARLLCSTISFLCKAVYGD